jgi:hypothetical protein
LSEKRELGENYPKEDNFEIEKEIAEERKQEQMADMEYKNELEEYYSNE